MNSRTLKWVVLTPVVFALALAGCVTAPASNTAEDRSLTITTSFTIDDLDPIDNSYWGVEFGYVELLMRPEADGTPSPWVLSNLAQVDDLTWKLELNPGVNFTNGTAFDADALAKILAWSAKNMPQFTRLSNFGRAEVTGDNQVTLTTLAPTPTMANLFADELNVPVLDVEAYEKHRASGADAAALIDAGIYTGPYRVTKLDAQGATLAPVANYWQGSPALDTYDIRFVTETTARIQAVQSGEADLALYPSASAARTLTGRSDAYYLQGDADSTVFGLVSRVKSPHMADQSVRQAIFSSIDYRAIAEDVLKNPKSLATGVFPPSYPYAIDTQSTDLDRANSLLDAAGWKRDGDGIRTKDGQRLTIRILAQSSMPDGALVSEAIQAQLAKTGIGVEITVADDYRSARSGDDWDLSLAPSLVSYGGGPDQNIATLLSSDGENAFAGIADPELDELIKELEKLPAGNDREDVLKEIQRLVWDRGYYVVAAHRLLSVVAASRYQGYQVPVSNLWVDYTTAPTS